MSDPQLKIGQILVKQGTLSVEAVEHALLLQRATSVRTKPLVSQLLESGLISETDALRALSEQFGVPGIDLLQVAILAAHLDHVPEEIARGRRLLPVLAREDRLFLAMSNPNDKRAIDELEFVTGRKIFPYVAVFATLQDATVAAYGARDRGETYYLAPNVSEQTLVQLGLKAPTPEKRTPLVPPAGPGPSMGSRSIPAVDPRGANATIKAPPRNLATPLDENLRETVRPREVIALGEDGYAQVLDKVARTAEDDRDPVMLDAKELDQVDGIAGSLGPAAMLTSPSFAAAPEGNGKLVLVVDDEEGIRKLFRRMLKSMGHRVIEAQSGRDALALLRQHGPELVIMDAMLPELHGFDVARRMRASKRFRDVPIIMMSGVYRGWRIVADLRENYGIHDYVEKPFNTNDMTELLARHLTRAAASEAASHASRASDAEHLGAGGRDPNSVSAEAEALLVIGVEAYKAGDMERAVSALKRGIELDPESYRLRYQLALLYGKRGQVYDGIRELERAVELAPTHFPALKNLAILYEKAGFKNKAVEMWERCVPIAPDEETRLSIKEHLVKLL